MNRGLFLLAWTCCVTMSPGGVKAQDRDTKVRNDRRHVEDDGYWIYNDLERGFTEARRTGKPLLVALRCIPCEACAQLDSQIVNRDEAVRKLLDQFVCVRLVHANGLDLALFQYDYDQSFAAFMLNADRTIYGRYGTRSHETESHRDVAVEGFARALEGALALHADFPASRNSLQAKHGGPPLVRVPEEFPTLKGKYSARLDYDGKVAKSCIHCHQVGEALRRFYRDRQEAIPDRVLFPYPMPQTLGFTLDPRERATVLAVAEDSAAQVAGFESGDRIESLEGQPLLSIADVQWVLHQAGDSGALKAQVVRGDRRLSLSLKLPAGWRRTGALSWRATSWELRRMTTGGMVLESVPVDELARAGVSADRLALRVKYMGEYDAHAAGKNAGFMKGDILIEVDGKSDPMTESALMAWMVNRRFPGEQAEVVFLRAGKEKRLRLPIQ